MGFLGALHDSDGHKLVVDSDTDTVYIEDMQEHIHVLALDMDEAGKLAMRLMESIGYPVPVGFTAFVEDLHHQMDKHREEAKVARVRHRYAVMTFGVGFRDLGLASQNVVDLLIEKDRKIEELEGRLKDVE